MFFFLVNIVILDLSPQFNFLSILLFTQSRCFFLDVSFKLL